MSDVGNLAKLVTNTSVVFGEMMKKSVGLAFYRPCNVCPEIQKPVRQRCARNSVSEHGLDGAAQGHDDGGGGVGGGEVVSERVGRGPEPVGHEQERVQRSPELGRVGCEPEHAPHGLPVPEHVLPPRRGRRVRH